MKKDILYYLIYISAILFHFTIAIIFLKLKLTLIATLFLTSAILIILALFNQDTRNYIENWKWNKI